MKIIKRVTQFPLLAQPEGDIAFNINTKQLRVYKDNAGNYTDYDSFYVSPDVDALGVNGYYPLYRTKALSDAASPLGTSHEHDGTFLGTAPDGVDYPLYMPDGLSTNHHGTYIDPVGDDDLDGIPNFRDPDILGLTALPSAGIKSGSGSIDGYTTPISTDSYGNQVGGINVAAGDITSQISNPGAGSYNDTGDTIIINATGPGVLIKATGSVIKFNLNDPVNIEPGDTFVYQGGMTGSGESSLGNEGGDSAGYTGSGNFQAPGGQTVNVEDELSSSSGGAIDTGTTNNTGDNITKSFTGTGVLVGPDGTTTQAISPVVIPDGSTLFVKSGSGSDDAHWNGTTNPVILSGGNSIDLTGYLTLDGDGDSVVNNSGDTSSFTFTGDGFLVSPEGAITGPLTSPASIPPGYRLFTGVIDPTHSGGSSGSGTGGTGNGTGTPANLTPDSSGEVTVNGQTVNLNNVFSGTGIGTIDGGTTNSSGGNITTTLDENQVGFVIGGGGTESQQTGSITYGDGETLVVKTKTITTTGEGTPTNPLITSPYGGDPTSLLSADSTTFTTAPLLGFVDEFMRYDFGLPTEITKLNLIDYSYSEGEASLIIQSSDDGVTWNGFTGTDSFGLSVWPDAATAGEGITSISVSPITYSNQYYTSVTTDPNKIPVHSNSSASVTFTPFTARYVRILIWQYAQLGSFSVDQVVWETTADSTGGSDTSTTQYDVTFLTDGNSTATAFTDTNRETGTLYYLSQGQDYNLANTPNTGFEFDKWVITSGGGTLTNASDKDSATYVLGTSDATLTATYKAVAQPITYNIIFRPDSNGLSHAFSSNELAGSVINLGEVPSLYHNMATSTLSGFEFDKWTFTESVANSGGSLTNASDPDAAQFTTGSSQAVVTANFKAVSTGTGSGTSGGSSSNDTNFTVSTITNHTESGGLALATVAALSNLSIWSYGTGATNNGIALKIAWNSDDEFFRFTNNSSPGATDHFIKLNATNQTIKLRHSNDQVAVSGESTITLEGSDGSSYTYDFSSNPNGVSFGSIQILTS